MMDLGRSRVSPGQFPISCEAYELLRKASAHVDWIVLAFCPLYSDEVRDAAIIRCRNGMFETSAAPTRHNPDAIFRPWKEGAFRQAG